MTSSAVANMRSVARPSWAVLLWMDLLAVSVTHWSALRPISDVPVASFLGKTIVILLHPRMQQVLPIQLCHHTMCKCGLARCRNTHSSTCTTRGANCCHANASCNTEACPRVSHGFPTAKE